LSGIKDNYCLYFDKKTIPTIKNLPSNQCLKNQKLLTHALTYNCYLNPNLYNIQLDFMNYFGFSYNTDRNYYYIGYENYIANLNKIDCMLISRVTRFSQLNVIILSKKLSIISMKTFKILFLILNIIFFLIL
jgi:hypothetical protein